MPQSQLTGLQFVAAAENLPIGTALVLRDGRFVWTNVALRTLLGYSATEFESLSMDAMVHPDHRVAELAQRIQVFDGNSKGYQIEQRWVQKDGSPISCFLTASLVRGAVGNPDFLMLMIQDNRRLKTGEAENAVLIERLALATRTAGVGIWEWDIPTNALIFDDQMFEIYGTHPTPGRPCNDVFLSAVLPDQRERVIFELTEAIAGRSECDTEFPIKTPSGEIRQIRSIATVIRDASGVAFRMIGTNWDVTAEKLHNAVQHEQSRFRAAIQAVEGVLWTNDAEGRMVGEQPGWAALTGQRFADYQGYGWAAAVHPDDAQPSVEAWNSAVAERRTFVFEHRVKRHDGVWRLFAIRGVPLFDLENGSIIEWVGVHTDITEQRKAEAEIKAMNAELEMAHQLERDVIELEQARRQAEAATAAKGTFLANMSHEIRTPMNGVIGFTELLLAGDLNAEQRRQAEMIADSSKAMMRLLNDILDLSKVEAGQITLANEPFDLVHALKACMKLIAPAAEHKGVGLECDFDPALPAVVKGDALRLRQIVLNLLGNAAKFTTEGTIKLTASIPDGDQLVIEVRDTGIGIPPERHQAIFEQFTQADAQTAGRFGGTGLGLAISSQLAVIMGGKITVESEVDIGTSFTLSLPLAPMLTDLTLSSVAVQPVTPAARRAGLRILVAEDHDVNRLLITHMLAKLGFVADLATDGQEAVTMVAAAVACSQPYALVFMDMQMPVMDGMDATRAIRNSGLDEAALPIVALTANAYAEDVAACLAVGMQGHVSKPFSLETLEAAIRRWVPDGDVEPLQGAARFSSKIQDLYQLRKKETLERLDALVRAGTFEEVELSEIGSMLHKLAGTAEMFGDATLGVQAKALETGIEHWTGNERAERIADAAEALRRAA
jgi:PAS domain S-box-containing protein